MQTETSTESSDESPLAPKPVFTFEQIVYQLRASHDPAFTWSWQDTLTFILPVTPYAGEWVPEPIEAPGAFGLTGGFASAARAAFALLDGGREPRRVQVAQPYKALLGVYAGLHILSADQDALAALTQIIGVGLQLGVVAIIARHDLRQTGAIHPATRITGIVLLLIAAAIKVLSILPPFVSLAEGIAAGG